ncbi:MAG: glycosyltransferase, partial [Alphaproteobacteria bacterium]
MAKEPRAGAVKTRLARDIGTAHALRIYRAMSANMLRRLADERRWTTVLALAPATATGSAAWPGGFARIPQGGGDLGARLERVTASLPPGPVVVIGTDIPQIGPGHIAQAFRQLGSHDAVFGPAGDGGYWLVGLKRSPRIRR